MFCIGVAQAQNSLSQNHANNIFPPSQTLLLAQQDGPSAVQSSPETQEETTLPTVTVTGQSERDPTTENTGSYTTGATTTTTKLPLTLRETPQTITVITRQQMDDFGLNTVSEVLTNTSSVYVEKRGVTDAYQSRGFAMQRQYDGIANPAFASGPSVSPDSAFLDHIEIQQGAAGLLPGAGDPGGTVNLVRKRPTETFQAQVEAELGSWDKKRLVGDISGPLTQSGVLRGRFVAVADDSDSYVDYIYDNKKAFYGVLELLPSADTKIGLGVQYQKDKYREHMGVPTAPDGSDLGWSRSAYFGVPDHSNEQEVLSTFLYFEQKLPNDWVLKANYAHNKRESGGFNRAMENGIDLSTGDGLFFVSGYSVYEQEADTVDVHASGPMQLLGRRHEFALGVNGAESKSCSGFSLTGFSDGNIYDYDPSDFPFGEKPQVDCGDKDRTRQHGIWGVARLNIADPLKVILGARVSWYEFRNTAGVQTMEEKAVLSPYAGIIYDLNTQLSVYASYSDIFKPQTAMDRTGSVLEPVVGANYEVGIKGEFFNKRLNAAAAIFRLEQTNLAAQDVDFGRINNVCPGWCYYASGKVISEGVDLSLNGALTPNWNVSVGYTFSNNEYATGENKGDRYEARIPKQIFRVSTTYRIPSSHWTVGGNLRAQSATYNDYYGAHSKQGGFALFGLMAKYQITPQAEISFIANNVFDRKYRFPNMSDGTHYGEPRSVFASVRYRF
jgi:outer membrane receptor for ferric coprogen and ferric-rhodotorulic acid